MIRFSFGAVLLYGAKGQGTGSFCLDTREVENNLLTIIYLML